MPHTPYHKGVTRHQHDTMDTTMKNAPTIAKMLRLENSITVANELLIAGRIKSDSWTSIVTALQDTIKELKSELV